MKDFNQLKDLLDTHYLWPTPYTFKFIVPTKSLPQITDLFCEIDEKTLQVRPSKKGNYHSVTFEMMMTSSGEVINVYQRALTIEGIFSL